MAERDRSDRVSSPTAARSRSGSSAPAAPGVAHRRDLHRPRRRGAARAGRRPGGARGESYLDIDAVVAAAVESPAPTRSTPATASCPSARRSRRRSRTPGITLVGPTRRRDGRDGPQGRRPRRSPWRPGCRSCRRTTVDDDPATFAYPVLVKAAAGGGGKGMRVVRSADEYAEASGRGAARGAVVVRRRHDAGREVRRVRPPHRGAGHGRHPRHGAPPLRARLLHPAPPPEGAGGGARADDQPRSSARRSRARPSPSPSRSATPAPAPSSSCSTTPPASSTSSR